MVENNKVLAYWLALALLPGMGPKRFASLYSLDNQLASFFNGEQPTQDLVRLCRSLGIADVAVDWEAVSRHLRWNEKSDCHLLTWMHPDFPSRLKETEGCPPLLFVQGKLNALGLRQIAVVGSRHPTHEGKENAYHFAFELARQGFVITSGLALGIDGQAHEGALAAKGLTLAVLGSGLDNIYPPKHRALAAAIVDSGALISEFPLGTQPHPGHFPRRNRIISGLSLGVLVIECSLKSGSLITANYALEQGREVFALPGSIHNPLAKGCHALIRQGAKCVDTVEHILEEFPKASKPTPFFYQEDIPEKVCQKEEGPLLSLLCSTFSSIDSLIERSGLTAEQVSSMLLELELRGEAASVPGGYVRITTGGTP